MDENRKNAYRYLLYWATLEIRRLGWSDESDQPDRVLAQYHYSRRAGRLANWLHNLALSSSHDFIGFDEDEFWRKYKRFKSAFPNSFDYDDLFEEELKKRTNP